MKSAPSAKVHQYLLPVMTQESPSRTARQEILEISDPALGSDIENAPRYWPDAIWDSACALLAGARASMPINPFPRAIRLATLIHPRASSSETRQYSKQPNPRPPNSSGMVMPK